MYISIVGLRILCKLFTTDHNTDTNNKEEPLGPFRWIEGSRSM